MTEDTDPTDDAPTWSAALTNKTTGRRNFLIGVGGAGVAATAGCAEILPDDDPDSEDPDSEDPEPDVQPTTITMSGIVTGWMGVQPARIADRANPTLELVPGEEYELEWTSTVQATPHNFVIEDEDGEAVINTAWIEEDDQTVEFTAQEDFESYYCAPHPVSMRGPIEIVDEIEGLTLIVNIEDEAGDPVDAEVSMDGQHSFSLGGLARFDRLESGSHEIDVWTFGHQRVTEEVTIEEDHQEVTITVPRVDTEVVDREYELILRDGQLHGEAPQEIAGETNPTLQTSPGEVVEIAYVDEDGVRTSPPDDIEPPLSEAPRSRGWVTGHNLAVRREGGSALARTEMTFDQGETESLRFVAEEAMGEYMIQNIRDAIGNIEVV